MDDYKDADDRADSRDIIIEELNTVKTPKHGIVKPENEIDPEVIDQLMEIISEIQNATYQTNYAKLLYRTVADNITAISGLNERINFIEFLVSRLGHSDDKGDTYLLKTMLIIFKNYENSLCEMVILCNELTHFLNYKKFAMDVICILDQTIDYADEAATKLVNNKIFQDIKLYIFDPYNKVSEKRIVAMAKLFSKICSKISREKFQQYLMHALPIMHTLLFSSYMDSKSCALAVINRAIRLPDAPVRAIVTDAIFEHLVVTTWHGLLTVRIASLLNYLSIVAPEYFYGYAIMQHHFVIQLVEVMTVNTRIVGIVMKLLMNCSMVENGAKYLMETGVVDRIAEMSENFSSSNLVRFFTVVMRAFLADPNSIIEKEYFKGLLQNSSSILSSSILDITADAFFETLHLLMTSYSGFLENIDKEELLEALSYWEDNGLPEIKEKSALLITELSKE